MNHLHFFTKLRKHSPANWSQKPTKVESNTVNKIKFEVLFTAALP